MAHKVSDASHAEHHNHLTGGDKLNTSDFSHVVSVRSDRLKGWLDKGYEVISGDEGSDSCLIGKRKAEA